MICPNLIKCEAPLLLGHSPVLSGSDPLPSAPLRSRDPSHYHSITRSQTHGPTVCHHQCHALHWPVCFSEPCPYLASPVLDTHLVTHLLVVPPLKFDIMTPALFHSALKMVSAVTVPGLFQTLGLTMFKCHILPMCT